MGDSNAMTMILKRAKRIRVKKGNVTKRAERDFKILYAALEKEGGPWAIEFRWSLQDGRDKKKKDASLDLPKGTKPCWHLDFNSLRPVLDISPLEM